MVSIVVPAFNMEKFIAETIDSVLNQTYSDWELIIINDGSIDNTIHIVEPYLEKDSRIKLINIENGGVSNARNVGIKESKGQMIAFLDADDTWKPQNLIEKVTVLNEENFDWVFCDMDLIDSSSIFSGEKQEGCDEDILKHYLLWDRTVVPGPCSNIVLKRKCLENGLLFDTQFSSAADQDFCFYLSSKFLGKKIPKSLWNYRVLSESMSRNIKVMESDHIGVYKKALRNNLFSSFWFKNKCFSNMYLIIGSSWWVNGQNKTRGLFFLLKGLIIFPPSIFKLIKKIF